MLSCKSHWASKTGYAGGLMSLNEDRNAPVLDNDAPNLAVLHPMAPNVHAGAHDDRIPRSKFTGAGWDDRYGPVARPVLKCDWP
jgi:hypothetical protein